MGSRAGQQNSVAAGRGAGRNAVLTWQLLCKSLTLKKLGSSVPFCSKPFHEVYITPHLNVKYEFHTKLRSLQKKLKKLCSGSCFTLFHSSTELYDGSKVIHPLQFVSHCCSLRPGCLAPLNTTSKPPPTGLCTHCSLCLGCSFPGPCKLPHNLQASAQISAHQGSFSPIPTRKWRDHSPHPLLAVFSPPRGEVCVGRDRTLSLSAVSSAAGTRCTLNECAQRMSQRQNGAISAKAERKFSMLG